MSTKNKKQEHILPQQHTGILDSGATHLYIAPTASNVPPDTSVATIKVCTANGKFETLAAKAILPISQLASYFPSTGYIMPYFTNTIIGVGPICDANCTVVFKKKDIILLSTEVKTIITGWRENKLPRLWRFDLKPNDNIIADYTKTNQTTPALHSA